jgi:ABC-type bacteriocin/lantibiotic exporter with double-glycine peptidase domain
MIVTTLPHIIAFEQTSVYDCGAAAVRSIYASLTGIVLDDKSLKDKLKVDKIQGTRSEEIKKFFEEKKLVVTEAENFSIDDIKKELGQERLCLVVYQAWGTEKEYEELESGHYSVIYGVDDEDVYLLDPSIHKDDGLGLGKRKLSLERFSANWRDKDEDGRVYTKWCLSVGLK